MKISSRVQRFRGSRLRGLVFPHSTFNVGRFPASAGFDVHVVVRASISIATGDKPREYGDLHQ